MINTAFVSQKLAEAESCIVLPAETQSHQQTILIYNNIDFLEETFSRSGTSHNMKLLFKEHLLDPLNRVKIEKSQKQSVEVPMDKMYVYKTGC